MQLVARTLRYLATRFLAEPHRSSQDISRTNAAEAHARLQERRKERTEVDSFLHARGSSDHRADETSISHRWRGVENTQ